MMGFIERMLLADRHPDDPIWRMHCIDAMTPREIAARVGRTEREVREHIVGLWDNDRNGHARGW